MANARNLLVKVNTTANTSGLNKADKSIQKLHKETSRLNKTTMAYRATLQSLALPLTIAFAAGTAAIVNTTKAAGDLAETLNKFEVIFGNSAAAQLKWANSFADTVGRSRIQVAEWLVDFKAFSRTLGVAEQESSRLAQTLLTRAVDIGSLYNIPTEEVIQRFFSGLAGQAESLRRLNIFIGEEDMARLAESYGTSIKNLSQQEKGLLRIQKILSDSEITVGDAVKTLDQFNNQLQFAQGNIRDLAANIGKVFLPPLRAMLRAFNVVADTIKKSPLGSEMVGRLLAIATAFVGIATAIALANVALKLFAFLTAPLSAIIFGILLLIDDIIVTIQGGNSLLRFIGKAIMWILKLLYEIIAVILGGIVLAVMKVLSVVMAVFKKIFQIIGAIISKTFEFFGALGEGFGVVGKKMFEVIKTIASTIFSFFSNIFGKISNFLSYIPKVVGDLFYYIGGFVKGIFDLFLKYVIEPIAYFFSFAWLKDVHQYLKLTINYLFDLFYDYVIAPIANFFSFAWLKDGYNIIKDAFNWLLDAFEEMFIDPIVKFFSFDWLTDVANLFPDWLKDLLGIEDIAATTTTKNVSEVAMETKEGYMKATGEFIPKPSLQNIGTGTNIQVVSPLTSATNAPTVPNINITINGATDPEAIGKEVNKIMSNFFKETAASEGVE